MSPLNNPRNHKFFWMDFLPERKCNNLLQNLWWVVKQANGRSNYRHCLNRTSKEVRNDVYKDDRVKGFVNLKPENNLKVEKVLDEMAHLLPSIHLTYKLKLAGVPFIKCISKIYSSIYVNGNILPSSITDIDYSSQQQQQQQRQSNAFNKPMDYSTFKSSYLQISKESRFIILPTHRSYMDFLLISYILFHSELPLPIVAAGDNFKSLGVILSNFLKGTGAFLVRRNAQNKHDIEASDYYDILRAYVHSLLQGGENPIEFFMEGTRTRTGQVLKPKTGLLSMVVDMFLNGQVDDLQILPVAINYQRPIEEQLYVKEILPENGMKKPKENFKNLMTAFDTIMTRQYGKVYVRFCQPIKISEFFSEWAKSMDSKSDNIYSKSLDKADPAILHDFTNCLAARVCLVQAANTVLMPFNLIACSLLYRIFFNDQNTKKDHDSMGEGDNFIMVDGGCPTSNVAPMQGTDQCRRIKVSEILDDFSQIENLLIQTQPNFIPGWKGQLEILEEFCLDRDNVVRVSSDRNYVECNKDPITFHTLLYYSNQITQVLLPTAIVTLKSNNYVDLSRLHYKDIRHLLSAEFLMNETLLEKEERDTQEYCNRNKFSDIGKSILMYQIIYYIESYASFLDHLEQTTGSVNMANNQFLIQNQSAGHFIGKDTLKNMIGLVITAGIASRSTDGSLVIEDRDKLSQLHSQYRIALEASSSFVKSMDHRRETGLSAKI